jgi:hypothetical protein
MGNQQNSSNSDKKREKNEIIFGTKEDSNQNFCNIISNPDTNSSYRGVKTTVESSTNNLDKNMINKEELTTECQTIPDKIDLKDIKIQTYFEWKDGGNIVHITGAFSNWSQWFIMNKINNKFELNLVNIFLNFKNEKKS